jgi:cytochrome c oxidase assembly protein subunit 11
MTISKKKFLISFLILIFFLILGLLSYVVINKFQKEKDDEMTLKPITINLLTSVHPNLLWNFKSIESEITVRPGEVTTIEYMVENLGNKETTGIATFAYFPNQFGNYISKINCFCYDAQTLKPKQKDKYTLVLLIDPEVTKDSKTKNIKEVTIQFIFFDYKEYKEKKSY